jgi:glucose/arabinose dehydrogenase
MTMEGSDNNSDMVQKQKELIVSTIIILVAVLLLVPPGIMVTEGQQQQESSTSPQQPLSLQQPGGVPQQQVSNNTFTLPVFNDSRLEVELVVDGLRFPTGMDFIGNHGDMLILEKDGSVIFFSNQSKTKTTILNFTVNERSERGLLGVAVASNNMSAPDITTAVSNETATGTRDNNNNTTNTIESSSSSLLSTPTFVFVYLTEASKEDRSQILGNRIHRFEWNDMNKSLSNGVLILDLPALPGPNHNGGKLVFDSENMHLYAVIGDLNRNGMPQNFDNGSLPDGTSAILRINPDGSPAQDNPFLNVSRSDDNYANLSNYYAYGIRNSFGLAIDPVTGELWDTENGPFRNDEINIVRMGFNSGWEKVMGPIERTNITAENDLVNFNNLTSYANPVFTWGRSVGVTDIEFFNSDKLGNNYTNNIFVGDFNNGNLYYFEVNESRTGLQFEHPQLADDLVASNDRQRAAVIFGTGFTGGITDIETGSDGYLYILTYSGKVYRVIIQQ